MNPPIALFPAANIHYEEAIQDILLLFSAEELKREPYLVDYISEMLARWGRWTSRGRAPAMCFESACAGALRYLERNGLSQTACTARVDAAVARALAGTIVNTVEPNAIRGPVRDKAVSIVADEFLARASSPKLSLPARRRMKQRETAYRKSGSESPLTAENNTEEPASVPQDETLQYAKLRKQSLTSDTHRKIPEEAIFFSPQRKPSADLGVPVPRKPSADFQAPKEDHLISTRKASLPSEIPSAISLLGTTVRKVRPGRSNSSITAQLSGGSLESLAEDEINFPGSIEAIIPKSKGGFRLHSLSDPAKPSEEIKKGIENSPIARERRKLSTPKQGLSDLLDNALNEVESFIEGLDVNRK